MTLERAINRAFDRCNLIGSDVDIYSIMNRYKVIRDLYFKDNSKYESIYNEIAEKLAFTW